MMRSPNLFMSCLAGMIWVFPLWVYGQSLVPQVLGSAGTQSVQGNIQLSYTVGETVVASLAQDTLLLTQGFHQSFSDDPVSLEDPGPVLQLQVFPNPFRDIITLRPLGDFPSQTLTLRLMDATGRLAMEGILDIQPGLDQYILPGHLPAGAYTLQILDRERPVFTPLVLIRSAGQ